MYFSFLYVYNIPSFSWCTNQIAYILLLFVVKN
nr:MAG TPA: FcoT-like thioesterase domain protein [Caudoviricetes sp.]